MRASEFMSTPVVSVPPEATLKELMEQMAAHRISGVPVIDHRGTLMGIVSESDVLTKLEYGKTGHGGLAALLDRLARGPEANRKLTAHTAADLMTRRVVTAGPDASFRELIHLMTVHDVNRVPIVEAGRVVGIVTRADLLRGLARADKAISEEAEWRLLHDLWIDPAALTISTHGGRVTIAGEVGTRSEAELVKRWVAAVQGVVDVDASALRYRLDDRRVDVAPLTGSLESPPRK